MKIVETLKSISKQDYLFSVISKILGVIIAIIYSAFYNRYLGALLKGEAAIISNYISIISSFTAFGMYQAYPFYRRKDKEIFYPFVNNTTSFYFLMTLSCLFLAVFIPVNSNLRIAIIIVPIQSYIRQINYVVMNENPRKRSFSSIIINLSDLIVIIAFFFFSEATYGYLISILIIQNLINLIISYSNLKIDAKRLKFELKEIPKYAKFGFLPMITLFLMTVNYRVDILMMKDFFNISTQEIGIYSVGVALAEKIWLIPDALKDILMSRLSNGKGAEEVAKVTRMSLAVSLIMLIVMAVFGKPFILLLYGWEFEKAYEILVIMLIGVVGMVFYKMIYAYNVVNGKRAINLLFLCLAAIINVIGNYCLIPIGGIFAAAWSSVISYLVCGIAFLIYFYCKNNIKLSELLIIKKSDISATLGAMKNKNFN